MRVGQNVNHIPVGVAAIKPDNCFAEIMLMAMTMMNKKLAKIFMFEIKKIFS